MRFSKKLFAVMLVVMLGFTALTGMGWSSSDDIRVTIDGVEVDFEGQGPVMIDSRVLVPVRGVFEALGFVPTWSGSTRTATLTRDDYVVVLTIGSETFTTNGEEFTLDVPAQLIGGRTLLPLRAVLESVGYSDMSWSGSARTVTIRTGNSTPPPVPTPAPSTPTPRPSQTEDFVGAWDVDGLSSIMDAPFFVFRADGSGAMFGIEVGWSTSDGVLEICTTPFLCQDDCWLPMEYEYFLDGDTLEIRYVSDDEFIILVRTSTNAPGPTPTPIPTPGPSASTNPADLVGAWSAYGLPFLELNADGSGTLLSIGAIGWTTDNGVLLICLTPHLSVCVDECWRPEEFYFFIDGNQLFLEGNTLFEDVIFVRM